MTNDYCFPHDRFKTNYEWCYEERELDHYYLETYQNYLSVLVIEIGFIPIAQNVNDK